jgi:hypothetical protein
MRRWSSAIGEEVSTVLVFSPLRFDSQSAKPPAAIVTLSIGKRSGDAVVRLDAPYVLLRELAHRQVGF